MKFKIFLTSPTCFTKIVYILFFLVFCLPLNASEIVLLKDGQLVKLNADKTWEYFEPNLQSESGKVVLSITEAVSKFSEFKVTDDFEKFKHYASNVGCEYRLKATNNTRYPVKLGRIDVKRTDVAFDFSSPNITATQFNGEGKILQQGESHFLEPNLIARIRTKTNQKSSQPANDNEIKKYKQEFGCGSFSGQVVLHESPLSSQFISFPDEAKVSNSTSWNFVIGSENGIEPLNKPIVFW